MKVIKIGNRLRNLLLSQNETIVRNGVAYYLGERYRFNIPTDKEIEELRQRLLRHFDIV